MGVIQPYFPKDVALKLAALANADIFVETGTYYGNTTKWASTEFKTIFTIELSDHLYNLTKSELLAKGNIIPKLGNSKNVLPDILEETDSNIIFWLDGHYSSGITAGADDPCPLREELEIILKRDNDDIIIIDDARCYTGGWGAFPSIAEICKIVNKTAKNKRQLQICNDHIYIVPDKEKYRELLFEYVLNQNILLWEIYRKFNEKKNYFNKLRIKTYMSCIGILKKLRLYNIAKKIVKGS